ncbi:MAG TPA: hypothetical protein PLI74_11845, partial [Candidatus Kapabacteria bacterium]|nr:hypothetical protein [Candidatus Kapabacteria bacterium]
MAVIDVQGMVNNIKSNCRELRDTDMRFLLVRLKDMYGDDGHYLNEHIINVLDRCVQIKNAFSNQEFTNSISVCLEDVKCISDTLPILFDRMYRFIQNSDESRDYIQSMLRDGSKEYEAGQGLKEDFTRIVSSYNNLVNTYLFLHKNLVHEIPKIIDLQSDIKEKKFVTILEQKREEQTNQIKDYSKSQIEELTKLSNLSHSRIKEIADSTEESFR